MNHKKLESGDRRLCSLTTGMKVRVRSGGRNKERTAAGVGMGQLGQQGWNFTEENTRLSYYLTKKFLP